ncbi:MAG: hypothetical protein WC566_01835 [Dehalococcoidia bacterium]
MIEWIESDGLLCAYLNDTWTGIAIARLTGKWAKPYKPATYHVRDFLQGKDIADFPSLWGAKAAIEAATF